nr:hypothetical protein [uncultured Mucilaginibacter sp.]
MKKYIFLILFLVLAGVFSCGKSCGCYLPKPQPDIRGKINNATWEPLLTDTVKTDSVTMWGKRSWDELKVKFKIDPTSTATDLFVDKYDATYTVSPQSEKGRWIYRLDNSSSANKIKISYRQADNFLEGQLNLTFKLTTPTGNMAFDTSRIYFTSTRFMVRLRK